MGGRTFPQDVEPLSTDAHFRTCTIREQVLWQQIKLCKEIIVLEVRRLLQMHEATSTCYSEAPHRLVIMTPIFLIRYTSGDRVTQRAKRVYWGVVC